MKRLFLISFMLLLIGAAYADGPRYRFKSRRALQTLWRKEMKENPNANGSGYRRMSARELQGEDADEMKKGERVYGVAVANPFEDDVNSGLGGSDSQTFGGGLPSLTSTTPGGSSLVVPGTTDDGEHLKGRPGTGGPEVGGTTTGGNGQSGYSPPNPPVGDGLNILLIFTAAFVAIKKRLSD